MNRPLSLGPIGGDKPHREDAERFLDFFHDLIANPKGEALDISPLPDDWRVLFSLANGFCVLAPELDREVGGYWTARKKLCDELLKLLPASSDVASNFLSKHIWIETRREICGIRQEPGDGVLSTLDEDIRHVDQFLTSIEYLRKRLPIVRGTRKPKFDHDANCYLFLMKIFLREIRGATIDTAVCQEIADFVNALLAAKRKKYPEPLDRADVKQRTDRFKKLNKIFADKVEKDPWAYIRRETA